MNNSPPDRRRDGEMYGAAALAAMQTHRHAVASDEMAKGMDALSEFARRNTRGQVCTVKGGIFERIVAAKFNTSAALQGVVVRAELTAEQGRPTAPEDIELRHGDRVVARVQTKMSDDPGWLAKSQSQEKYRGMQKVVPKDQVDATRAHAQRHAVKDQDHADTARRVQGDMHHGSVRAGATAHSEAEWATRHPRAYVAIRKGQMLIAEGAVASVAAAGNAALMAGLFSAVRHGVAVHAGRMSWGDAANATVRESIDAAKAGAVRTVAAVGLRHVARESGAATFAGSAAGGAVVASVVEVGATLWSFARGEISQREFAERAAGATVRNAVGILCSKGAVALGGTGAVATLAPMAGVMAAGYVFQSCVAILENARLAEAERIRIEALCAESMVALTLERAEVQRQVGNAIGRIDASLAAALGDLDTALLDDDSDASLGGLACALGMFGRTLRFPSFEAFEEFLDDPDSELVL